MEKVTYNHFFLGIAATMSALLKTQWVFLQVWAKA